MTFNKQLVRYYESGIGLLEVLIAVAVLSIALLSLGGLHNLIIKSSSLAKSRAMAASIAQEKLDDLRNFQALDGTDGTTVKVFGYNEIAADGGGEEISAANETPIIPSGNVTNGNITYTRNWTVQCYDYGGTGVAGTIASPCPATPAYKIVTMTVTWVDPSEPGATQTLSQQAVISAYSPATTGMSGIHGPKPATPNVPYTPLPAPDVVRISVGDSKYKEATKPDLDISQHGHSTVTSFDEITYSTSNITKTRDSYFTTSCICQMDGSSSEGYYPTRFNGEEFVVGAKGSDANSAVSKPIGALYTAGSFTDQHEICDICCRDHHDKAVPSADTSESCLANPAQYKCVYDPNRPSTDYTTGGDHKHYYSGPAGLTALPFTDNPDNLYYESCHMVRVNGFLHVAQDWRLEAFNIMPNSYLTNTTSLANYQAYVQAFVKAYINQAYSMGNSYPGTAVTPPVTGDLASAITTAAIPSTYTMLTNSTEQFHGRGIYLDYMDPTLLATLKSKIDANEDFLYLTPFHEVNLTKIGGWSSSNTSAATVTNDVLVTGGGYSRGNVTTTSTAASTNIVESDERGNSGLTDGAHTDPDDSTNLLSDTIALTGTAPPAPHVVTGSITIDDITRGTTGRSLSNIKVYCGNDVDPPSTYTADTNSVDNAYSCSLDSSGNGYVYVTSYVGKTTGNTLIDNCVRPTSVSGVTIGYGNDGNFGVYSPSGAGSTVTTAEYTRFHFTGVSADQVLNITIQKEASGGTCN